MPTNVLMPALSPTMTEGNLAKWHVKEGDTVEAGDVIAEIETDKATMEVEAVDEGTIGKILITDGTEGVAVNTPIAVLLEEGETANDIGEVPAVPKPEPAKEKKQEEEPQPKASTAPQTTPQSKGDRIYASPLAKRIAANKGINLATIKGSGPKGRIVKADVEGAKGQAVGLASSSQVADVPQGDEQINEFGMIYTPVPNNNIKKITAKRL
ncbi:MAG: biotin/lipoyl-containing protein, partial [Pseudomonadota bacterium]